MFQASLSKRSNVLLLWDIDGTLLDTSGAGVLPFKSAIEKYLKVEVIFDREKLAGKTDYQIIEILSRDLHPKKINAMIEHRILKNYSSGLNRELTNNPVRTLGDTRVALANLSASSSFELGILTGNCKSGMMAKLTSAGFLDFFPKKNVFFSSPFLRSREQILRNALSCVAKKVILIGDTPDDIYAARSLSTPVLSLATGLFDFDELSLINQGNVLHGRWTYDELISKLDGLS